MTDTPPRSAVRAVLASRITLWGAFVVVHFALGMLALYAPGLPLGDVTWVYKFWVENGMATGVWPGIQTVWVYPVLALLPMVAAMAFGSGLYASTWLSLVMLVDAAAFAVLLARRPAGAAWWWLGFLLALGPVAVGRIDAFTVPLALAGLLLVVTRPRLGAALLTVAAWVKVWPAALVAAAVVALRSRLEVLTAAAVTSGVVAIGGLLLGAGTNLVSFVTQQTGRGLQIESPLATPWMWGAALGGDSRVYYDTGILTFQVDGPGVGLAAALSTPLLAVATLALLAIAVVGVRRGVAPTALLAPLALALTAALMVFNKVGSPQFVSWLAVPVVAGLVAAHAGRAGSFRVPAILALAIAALTQTVYPYLYDELLAAAPALVAVLTVRNILEVALLGWAVVALLAAVRHGRQDETGRGAGVPVVAGEESP